MFLKQSNFSKGKRRVFTLIYTDLHNTRIPTSYPSHRQMVLRTQNQRNIGKFSFGQSKFVQNANKGNNDRCPSNRVNFLNNKRRVVTLIYTDLHYTRIPTSYPTHRQPVLRMRIRRNSLHYSVTSWILKFKFLLLNF